MKKMSLCMGGLLLSLFMVGCSTNLAKMLNLQSRHSVADSSSSARLDRVVLTFHSPNFQQSVRIKQSDLKSVTYQSTRSTTIVSFVVSSGEQQHTLDRFFHENPGLIKVSIGSDAMELRSLVHQPLANGLFKIYVDNADKDMLAFLDRIRESQR